MCRKAALRHSKTLGMDTVLPNHPALGATLTSLSARASGFRAFPANACRATCASGFRAFPANACRATCASGFRGTVVALSQPKTTVNNIVLGVVTHISAGFVIKRDRLIRSRRR